MKNSSNRLNAKSNIPKKYPSITAIKITAIVDATTCLRPGQFTWWSSFFVPSIKVFMLIFFVDIIFLRKNALGANTHILGYLSQNVNAEVNYLIL